MRLVEGETIIVTDKMDDDWWIGTGDGGKSGLFPGKQACMYALSFQYILPIAMQLPMFNWNRQLRQMAHCQLLLSMIMKPSRTMKYRSRKVPKSLILSKRQMTGGVAPVQMARLASFQASIRKYDALFLYINRQHDNVCVYIYICLCTA
jgi:hypothetical protein